MQEKVVYSEYLGFPSSSDVLFEEVCRCPSPTVPANKNISENLSFIMLTEARGYARFRRCDFYVSYEAGYKITVHFDFS